ncbi:hypothetical protein N0V93_007384 [Gnomoniopsis smithogilvyi]|uniref:Zn(2)-C6 fungal-type domain-containing protein n=1 Tax=Gnomoniopsis smithogilvyi TaxID=1191159 RepID=A0A9W8YRH3_9PEZI|nr:hypothetical protein N0V93_007384 [Gnomoniopsis smithogilvyi]
MASMSMSDLDDRDREREHSATANSIGNGNGNGNGIGDDLKIDVPDPDPDLDLAVSVAGDSVAGNASAPANPRKRKKSSRACDFCHVNHQPCDNAKPRCSYCERHNKSCLYLRPQKKRGPAQGYRSALHTLRESAAAWGAALNLIPSLGPVVEGYLKQPEGRRLVKAIKDPTQQEFFIQAWQQSGVFKTFFPDEASASASTSTPGNRPSATPDAAAASSLPTASPSIPLPHQTMASNANSLTSASATVISPPRPPVPQLPQAPQSHGLSMTPFDTSNPFGFVPPPTSSHDSGGSSNRPRQASSSSRNKPRQESISLSDIVAKDAARSSLGFSQTLGSLGFAPNETLEDFLDMTFNPEPMETPPVEQDPVLGSEQDQRAYYELLMGRRFT